jgi:diadenosine tetraphosphate (Ap4A) HIT family hydrolase
MAIEAPKRRSEYEKHLEHLAGECAFCKMSPELNIREYKSWTWTFAAFPYRKYHTLIIPRRHILSFSQLNPDEINELQTIIEDIEADYQESGIVGKHSEFGDQLLTLWRFRTKNENEKKKSVAHFHMHVYPKFAKEVDSELDENASEIDISKLKKGKEG